MVVVGCGGKACFMGTKIIHLFLNALILQKCSKLSAKYRFMGKALTFFRKACVVTCIRLETAFLRTVSCVFLTAIYGVSSRKFWPVTVSILGENKKVHPFGLCLIYTLPKAYI